MKKSIFLIASLLIILSFSSCEKEIIEIVNQESISTDSGMTTKSISTDGSKTGGTVTDPNEDEDFDADKKNETKPG